ncbi:hypothetical protein BVRB_9g226070 [Beta vulgaris subsp. vulgaris]|uniref:F-box domain-containing protein n=1 Tax=Beta vulgaris subsp. vulgaris TaxID=3555 RepID=A0A0J8B5Q2_BETVV|nr:hypothetical protein BVRB_9g226070 [Beta vulgaris subsp. vulgaris]
MTPVEPLVDDVWTVIVKHMDGRSLARLSCTCSRFHKYKELAAVSLVWRSAFLRELDLLDIPFSGDQSSNWKLIYTSSLRHTGERLHPTAYSRIGAFIMESTTAVLAKSDRRVKIQNVKQGIWILDIFVAACCI